MLVVMAFALLLTGCMASGPQRSTVQTTGSYKSVFNAAMEAAYDVGFNVASADEASGRILAEQAVVGTGGKVTRMNISVSETAQQGSEVKVTFIQPPGTVSYGTYGVDSYVAALKTRVPNAIVLKEGS
jgi:hypothetical protein